MRSWATLLTAYGDNGRSGFVSLIGSSSSKASPYSSLEPTTRNRAVLRRAHSASRRFTWLMMFVVIVSAGACHEAWTKLWAAR